MRSETTQQLDFDALQAALLEVCATAQAALEAKRAERKERLHTILTTSDGPELDAAVAALIDDMIEDVLRPLAYFSRRTLMDR